LFGWNNKGGALGNGVIVWIDQNKVNRIILQGRVVKLLDLFILNEMNKREKRGKSTKKKSS
jgi:hypothetical protein